MGRKGGRKGVCLFRSVEGCILLHEGLEEGVCLLRSMGEGGGGREGGRGVFVKKRWRRMGRRGERVCVCSEALEKDGDEGRKGVCLFRSVGEGGGGG
eukprot:362024-Chlamydomonas_euryale.AAC.4